MHLEFCFTDDCNNPVSLQLSIDLRSMHVRAELEIIYMYIIVRREDLLKVYTTVMLC